MLKRIVLICLIIFPAMVWATFKPVRILAPELVTGITCMSDTICLDDVSRYPEAVKLYDEALDFVVSTIEKIEKNKNYILFHANMF